MINWAKTEANKIYVNAFYLILSPLTMGTMGFLFWLSAARYFTAVEVGISSAIVQLTTFVVTLSLIGLSSFLIRFMPNEDHPEKLFGAVLAITCPLCLGLICVVAYTSYLWSNDFSILGDDTFLLVAVMALGLCSVVWDMTEGVFIAKRVVKYAFIRNVLFVVLRFGLLLLFAKTVSRYGIIVSWTVAILLGTFFTLYYLLPRLNIKDWGFGKNTLRFIQGNWRYAGSNYIVHTLQHMGHLLMPAFVVVMLGAEQGAYFYIAWAVAALIMGIPDAMAMSLVAEASNFPEKLQSNITKAYKFSFFILIPLLLVLVPLSKYVLLPFGDSYSQKGYWLLSILGISALPFTFTAIHKAVLRVRQKNLELSMMWIILTAIMYIGGYFFMQDFGIVGIGSAWLLANLIIAVYILIFRRGLHFESINSSPTK